MSGPKWYGDTNETPKAEPERQKRLDMFACAALGGRFHHVINCATIARMAYDIAEAMEKERARRIKESPL